MKLKTILVLTLVLFGMTACDDKPEQPKNKREIAEETTARNCADKFIKTTEQYNYTELGLAIHDGDLSHVKTLIKNDACTERCMSDEIFEFDAMYVAITSEQIAIVKYFIDLGIDVNRIYGESDTALSIASNIGNHETAYAISKMLIDAGARVNGYGDIEGVIFTKPLANAVNNKNTKLVKLLLDNRAYVNVINKNILNEQTGEIKKILSGAMTNQKNKTSTRWIGHFEVLISQDGTETPIMYTYTVDISADDCLFALDGVRAYQKKCFAREQGDTLYITDAKYKNELAIIINNNDTEYYIKGDNIFDETGKNNTEIPIEKMEGH